MNQLRHPSNRVFVPVRMGIHVHQSDNWWTMLVFWQVGIFRLAFDLWRWWERDRHWPAVAIGGPEHSGEDITKQCPDRRHAGTHHSYWNLDCAPNPNFHVVLCRYVSCEAVKRGCRILRVRFWVFAYFVRLFRRTILMMVTLWNRLARYVAR